MIPKLVADKKDLSRTLTYMKISESIFITLFIYMAGIVRTATGSFTGVTFMLLLCSALSMAASIALIQETQSVGSNMFKLATIKENI